MDQALIDLLQAGAEHAEGLVADDFTYASVTYQGIFRALDAEGRMIEPGYDDEVTAILLVRVNEVPADKPLLREKIIYKSKTYRVKNKSIDGVFIRLTLIDA